MIAGFLFIVAFIGFIFLGVYWYRKHHGICPDPKCGANVWLKFTDATPRGPNPLGIEAEVVTIYCKKCGTYKQACNGYDYRR
jgi:hypothetical protein